MSQDYASELLAFCAEIPLPPPTPVPTPLLCKHKDSPAAPFYERTESTDPEFMS